MYHTLFRKKRCKNLELIFVWNQENWKKKYELK